MVEWRRGLVLVVLLAAGQVGRRAAVPQAAPAVVRFPTPGATVAGQVAILGSAAAPQFEHFELAFAYDPDPSNTWFSIQEPVKTPMPDGLLGRWDTTGITDGLYVVRLRVYTTDGEFVEALVRGIAVRNQDFARPLETPAIAAAAGEATPTAGPVDSPPSAPLPLIALPALPTGPPTAAPAAGGEPGASRGLRLSAAAAEGAFQAGVQVTFTLFGLAGLYLAAKSVLRLAWRRWRRRA